MSPGGGDWLSLKSGTWKATGPGPPGLDTSLQVTREDLVVKEAVGWLWFWTPRAQITEAEASQATGVGSESCCPLPFAEGFTLWDPPAF